MNVDQTTPVVIRGMRGMSSMGKPQRPVNDMRSVLIGQPKGQSSSPVGEFTCTCSTGWTGPTCEISKFFFIKGFNDNKISLQILNIFFLFQEKETISQFF